MCLGETHQVCHPTAAGLCRDLDRFVANKDNASLARRVEGANLEQQLWPLVDKVVIFVKAKVLSTGAVIKDMVGLGGTFKIVPLSYHRAADLFVWNSLVAETEIPQGLLVQL